MVTLVDLEVRGNWFKSGQSLICFTTIFLFVIVYSVAATKLDDIKYNKQKKCS